MRLQVIFQTVAAIAAALASGTTAFAASDSFGETAAAPPPMGPVVPDLDWTDCGDGVQCADAEVPLDYDRPHGPTIEIALARRPAVDQANRIGSLFLHPGGPGGSGVDVVRGAPLVFFEVFSRFDVVGFDQRGLGASRPAVVDCGDDPGYVYRTPILRPPTVDKHEFLADTRAYTRNCRALNRGILPHLSTANVARDLDLLRAAVGDEGLNYLGISYGTVIGATYASLFPGRARALVLDSALDVQDYYDDPLTVIWERAQGHEDALVRFLDACAAHQDRCGFGGDDPGAALESLIARLDLEPIPSSDPADPRLLSGDGVRIALTQTVGSRPRWPLLAAGLRQAEAGDGSGLLLFLGGSPGAGDDFNTAVLAVDQRYARGPVRDYFDLAEQSYSTFDHFWFATGYPDLVRARWRVEDHDAFRGRIRNPATAAPILVIGNTHDASAPYFQVERLVADLGNARLLTYDADEHGAVPSFDPCVLEATVSYLNDGVLPAEGTVCVQQGEPFPPAGMRAAERPLWNWKAPLP